MANLYQQLLAQIHSGLSKHAREPGRAESARTAERQTEARSKAHRQTENVSKAQTETEMPGDGAGKAQIKTVIIEESIPGEQTEAGSGQRASETQTGTPEGNARSVQETQERERIQTEVEKEDFLLSQIDEFREKAKQLQELIAAKETKAQELQSVVNEREGKAKEWQSILTERQVEADKIVTEFTEKVDGLADCVTKKMTEIEASISEQVAQVKNASEQQLEANRKLNEDQIAANKKLSEEQLATNKQFLEEQAIANKKLSEGQIAEVKALLENATTQLESIKTDLSEKVHSENVKCYRNIQDLFNEFDSKIEKMDEMEQGVGSVKGYVKCLSWFSILNFVILIGFILYSLGVFNF